MRSRSSARRREAASRRRWRQDHSKYVSSIMRPWYTAERSGIAVVTFSRALQSVLRGHYVSRPASQRSSPRSQSMVRRSTAALLASLALLACDAGTPTPYHAVVLDGTDASVGPGTAVVSVTDAALAASDPASVGPTTSLPPNELGRVPILEYHIVGDSAGRWARRRGDFERDLQMLYERGYRPVTVAELVDGALDLPAGTSPVVFTFDDASPSQFRYIERDGQLEIDS